MRLTISFLPGYITVLASPGDKHTDRQTWTDTDAPSSTGRWHLVPNLSSNPSLASSATLPWYLVFSYFCKPQSHWSPLTSPLCSALNSHIILHGQINKTLPLPTIAPSTSLIYSNPKPTKEKATVTSSPHSRFPGQAGFHQPLPTSEIVLNHWRLPVILPDFSQHLVVWDHSFLPEIHFL